jgi:hypothetical protein
MRSPAAVPFDRLRGAPRPVSLALRVRVTLSGLGTVGCLAFIFSAPFVAAFGLPALLWDALLPSGPTVEIQGVVLDEESTNLRVNHQQVHRVSFSFVLDGQSHRATSFRTGPSGLVSGTSVSARVVPGHPETAVLAGMRRTESPVGLLALFLLPLIGVVLLAVALVRGARRVHLLQNGEGARGTLTERRPTGARINKQPVIEYVFTFRTQQGREARATARTHDAGALLDSKQEPLLYDPLDPSRAVLLGSLPGDPRLDDAGRFTAPNASLWLLLWPLAGALSWAAVFAASK